MVVTAAAIAIAAKPLVEKLAVELIAPKIQNFVEKCKSKYDENMIPREEHFWNIWYVLTLNIVLLILWCFIILNVR